MYKIVLMLLIYLTGSSSLMALEIVSVENPQYRKVLTTVAQKISFPLSVEDKNLIELMKQKLQDLGGVGLAAPQINSAKQIVVIYIPEEASLLRDNVKIYPMHTLINPSYEPVSSSEIHHDFEACYSVNSKAGKVPRYNTIKVSYYDELGQYHKQIENGFYARVLQHEIDHLNGTLILDRLTSDCVQGTMEEMMALRRAELSPEKRALFDQVMARKRKK